MGVYIKGIDMPRDCEYLDLVITSDGNVCCYDAEGVSVAKAIPVPDHGDLIDREAVMAELGINDFDCNKCGWCGLFTCKREDFDDACFALENAEAVIPAERSEDD